MTRQLLGGNFGERALVAFGDDRTDEERFAALPETAFTFCAGPGATRARYRVDGPKQVRQILSRFLARRTSGDERH
jgi:trehalose 6-phosphate synthase/phosphatase